MTADSPTLVVLAGPNGAGKSTVAPSVLKGALDVTEFVNADVIALGLSGFDPASAAIPAGRIMLKRARELARAREDFALETTLANRAFAPWIRSLIDDGYRFHLVFMWLSSADLAVGRVAERVRLGGHDVPEQTIRRRYVSGLENFFSLYRPMASSWRFYDNSGEGQARLIAAGHGNETATCNDTDLWQRIVREHQHANSKQ